MSKLFVLMFALISSLGVSAMVIAQSSSALAAMTQGSQLSQSSRKPVGLGAKSGDSNCQSGSGDTGNQKAAKKDGCVPVVAGHSYGGDEMRRIDTPSSARVLQMIEPRVGAGH